MMSRKRKGSFIVETRLFFSLLVFFFSFLIVAPFFIFQSSERTPKPKKKTVEKFIL